MVGPGQVHVRGSQSMFLSYISLSLPLSLKLISMSTSEDKKTFKKSYPVHSESNRLVIKVQLNLILSLTIFLLFYALCFTIKYLYLLQWFWFMQIRLKDIQHTVFRQNCHKVIKLIIFLHYSGQIWFYHINLKADFWEWNQKKWKWRAAISFSFNQIRYCMLGIPWLLNTHELGLDHWFHPVSQFQIFCFCSHLRSNAVNLVSLNKDVGTPSAQGYFSAQGGPT